MKFKPWVFQGTEHDVKTGEVLTFAGSGGFKYFCYLTPTGSTEEVKYRPDSGGNGTVRP